ncbi:MAG: PEP-CTERM sorting domain-containing protein [Phycisphaerae bacterium]|nr:PEP-CTERM sorting domain-containing protein [Phycisphaerae bacterium]
MTLQRIGFFGISCAFAMAARTAVSSAALVPFTENFTADSANWRMADQVTPLAWSPNGGPGGSSFASGNFSFANNLAGTDQSILRGHNSFGASGGAFVGNWLTDGVTDFSFWFRHDAPVPVQVFSRYAKPFSAGAVSFDVTPVQPNTWTKLTFNLSFGSSTLVLEGFPNLATYNNVFSDVQDLQIGIRTPAGIAQTTPSYRFDIDQVSILPEPASAFLCCTALAALLTRRRRRNG